MNWVQQSSRGQVPMHIGSMDRGQERAPEEEEEDYDEALDALREHVKRFERRPGAKAKAGAAKPKFMGKCNKCGKVGHKGFECRGGAKPKAKAKAGAKRGAASLEEDEVSDTEGPDVGTFEIGSFEKAETDTEDEDDENEDIDPQEIMSRLAAFRKEMQEAKGWETPKRAISKGAASVTKQNKSQNREAQR